MRVNMKAKNNLQFIKYVYNNNITGLQRKFNREIREKAEQILQKKAEKLYNKLFR